MKIIKQYSPYLIILIVVLLIRAFIVTPIMVNGTSMYDTLDGNEIMLLNKLGKLERFDIAVVKIPDDTLIKRIYGLPGETISCKNNKIYINDEEINDPYAFGETENFGPITLGENEYFLMGDNRIVSLDSRKLGAFKKDKMEGTTSFILFPFSKFGKADK